MGEEKLTSKQWEKKGIEKYDAGDYTMAVLYLNNAIVLDPTSITSRLQKGLVLEKLQKYSEAIKCFDDVLKLDLSTEIITQTTEYRNQAVKRLEKQKAENITKWIKEIGRNPLFGCVGGISIIACIASATFFFVDMSLGFTNWATLISALISFIFALAWLNVKNKFEYTSKMVLMIYQELKEKSDDK